MSDKILSNCHLRDLNPILFGEEKCAPGHSYGPGARDYVLIHFVLSGRGIFYRNGASYSVCAGEAFIAPPDELIMYRADSEDPWHYMWVGFDGALSHRFSALPAIRAYSVNWAEKILMLDCSSPMLAYEVASILFLMYSEWFAEKNDKHDYVKAVKDFINAKFTQDITVDGIAEHISLDRRYLSRVFKQRTGKSIQEYIIHMRIEKAKQLLGEGYNIAETAQRCGYDDICNFSKMFKKHTGTSPGKWGKENRSRQSRQ